MIIVRKAYYRIKHALLTHRNFIFLRWAFVPLSCFFLFDCARTIQTNNDPPPTQDGGQDWGQDADLDAEHDAGCRPSEKRCEGNCVSITDPLYGCKLLSCSPCVIPHAVPACVNSTCAIGSCNAPWENTNGTLDDGCEKNPDVPLNSLMLWLMADMGTTTEAGNAVSKWADQSDSGKEATQVTPEYQPKLVAGALGGLPLVEFDGTDDFLKLTAGFKDFSAGLSIFIVLRVTKSASTPSILHLSNGDEIDDISVAQDGDDLYYEVFNAEHYMDNNPLPLNTPVLLTIVHSPLSNIIFWVNGVQRDTCGTTPIPATIMREANFIARTLYYSPLPGPFFGGQIGEMLVFGRSLDDTERRKLEAYLQKKWSCCQ